MKTEDIIRMAAKAGLIEPRGFVYAYDQLEKFAKLVAEAERDACADVAQDSRFVSSSEDRKFGYNKACDKIARAIRRRFLLDIRKSI